MCGQTQGEDLVACEITVGGDRLAQLTVQPYSGVSYTSVQLDASGIQLEGGGKPLDLSGAVMNFIPAQVCYYSSKLRAPPPLCSPLCSTHHACAVSRGKWRLG